MKVKRKQFRYPSTKMVKVEREVSDGWWKTKKEMVDTAVELTYDEFIEKVSEFVGAIGHDRLINICEYRCAEFRIGDDYNLDVVVWYWEEESLQESHGEIAVQRPEHQSAE